MNDYKLINSLLKDGSEQSLFKLKMIVDLEEFDYHEIKYSHRIKFVKLFYEYCSSNINIIYSHLIPEKDVIEITEMFKDSVRELFLKNPICIKFIHPESKKDEVMKMFPDIDWKNY